MRCAQSRRPLSLIRETVRDVSIPIRVAVGLRRASRNAMLIHACLIADQRLSWARFADSTNIAMRYELYDWPGIPGRGEYVCLVLEERGAGYIHVGNDRSAGGVDTVQPMIEDKTAQRSPNAPPPLKAGKVVVAQVADILQYLGPRLDLVAKDPTTAPWTRQLQLTITDFVAETHDSHHPVTQGDDDADQMTEAKRRAVESLKTRIPDSWATSRACWATTPRVRDSWSARALRMPTCLCSLPSAGRAMHFQRR